MKTTFNKNKKWVLSFFLPVTGQGPLEKAMSSMAMSPASPPTVASRITWCTCCSVTWTCTFCHSSPWFPYFSHTYGKDEGSIKSWWEGIFAARQCTKNIVQLAFYVYVSNVYIYMYMYLSILRVGKPNKLYCTANMHFKQCINGQYASLYVSLYVSLNSQKTNN